IIFTILATLRIIIFLGSKVGQLEITYSLAKPIDKKRYKNTIKACALDKDINDFSHDDLTEIGQREINMSGGQKQRIQLARA
ncbi:hypothetical protein HN51_004558, partial [Arachis hypogaea]